MDAKSVENIRLWFLSQARDLPWRVSPTPYAVWVSEVMLQQTQVSVVIPYFERWMERFPTIAALAGASLEEVLKLWEGLGYYSRARNLHGGAKQVLQHFAGALPSTPEELRKIKGIGPYTVGAIMSFAFRKRAAAVDGNVLRVLSRYYRLEDDIAKSTSFKTFETKANALLPEREPWVISEALIELGATVCARKPKCSECPVRSTCKAYQDDCIEQYPVKSAKTVTKSLYRVVAVVRCEDQLLLKCGQKGKVMADLYEFPYFEVDAYPSSVKEQKRAVAEGLGIKAEWQMALPEVKHTFTRFKATLMPHLYTVAEPKEIAGYEWVALEKIQKLPFSSGHRRILNWTEWTEWT